MKAFEKLNIAVAGTGYVGLSIAVLLSQHHHVTAVDIVPEKVELINQKKSPIQDDYIEKYLAEKNLDLTATLDGETAYRDADFVIIAAPTNYDSRKNFFDTSAVEAAKTITRGWKPIPVVWSRPPEACLRRNLRTARRRVMPRKRWHCWLRMVLRRPTLTVGRLWGRRSRPPCGRSRPSCGRA